MGIRWLPFPSDSIIGACAEAKGVEVTIPDFEKAYETISGRRFDCMIFSEILQHLHDPVKILSRFANLLTDEGMIIISRANFRNVIFVDVGVREDLIERDK